MLLPSVCYVPSSNWGCTLRFVIHTDRCSRLISRPDVSTSCKLAAVTRHIYCLIFKFQLTYPANFCGFFLVTNTNKNTFSTFLPEYNSPVVNKPTMIIPSKVCATHQTDLQLYFDDMFQLSSSAQLAETELFSPFSCFLFTSKTSSLILI